MSSPIPGSERTSGGVPGTERRGFTLVELLVALAVTLLLLVLSLAMINQTSSLWKRTTGKVVSFQEARSAFEAMTRKVSQATLNTYWDYDPPVGNPQKLPPGSYVRQSELHFVSGQAVNLLAGVIPEPVTTTHAVFFQAPLGYTGDTSAVPGKLQNLLNASGFFVQYENDAKRLPAFIKNNGTPPGINRYRLMELWQPSQNLGVYAADPTNPVLARSWFRTPVQEEDARPIADNIIALIIRVKRSPGDPGDPISDNYAYDSRRYQQTTDALGEVTRNQLPPVMEITMVAIDENSAVRLENEFGDGAPPLQPGVLFTDELKFESDLYAAEGGAESLEGFLQSQRLEYRIFTTGITIRQAKWSE